MMIWKQIDWKRVEKLVFKMQVKIADAWKHNDMDKVNSLSRILINSIPARLLTVKRVISNQGSNTPGVDGVLWTNETDLINAVIELGKPARDYKAKPVKRVYIPKTSGKLRPLGIPTLYDRAMQALYSLPLIAISETTADNNSFGFRPGRSTHDAVQTIYNNIKGYWAPKIILDADIQGFFDNVSHEWIIKNIPMNQHVLKQFLQAGYIDGYGKHDTALGVPQGGIISPIIANMVLDGLEACVKHSIANTKTIDTELSSKVTVVRYADDFVVIAPTSVVLNDIIKPAIVEFLAERGLSLNPDKTQIVNVDYQKDSLNFLGFVLVRVQHGSPTSHILVLRPTADKVKALKAKIEGYTSNTNLTGEDLISRLNPLIRGWANYFRIGNCTDIFSDLDYYVWDRLLIWSKKKYITESIGVAFNKHFMDIKGAKHFVSDIKLTGKKRTRVLRFREFKVVYYKVTAKGNYFLG